MNCSPHDLRDYFFEELAEAERRQMDAHVATCETCRGELARLRTTQSALLGVRDEEVPQRIGFVSDRVYEPSVIRRGWRAFWNSGPRLVFASAAMLSAALVVSALVSVMARPVTVAAPAEVAADAKLQGAIARQVTAAVEVAIAASEQRQAQKTAELLAAAGRTQKQERHADMRAVSKAFEYLNKRVVSFYKSSVEWSEPR